ncbi:MAG: hypothetical protein ACN6NZ_05335, partial [Burkholderiales bacterium]
LILRAGDPSLSAARALFQLILDECQRTPTPSSALLERLSHLLFLYVLRQQVHAGNRWAGWSPSPASRRLPGCWNS